MGIPIGKILPIEIPIGIFRKGKWSLQCVAITAKNQ